METISIGKEQVPALGLGTYNLQGRAGEQAISSAISMGYRHIDTAQFYRNEDAVGNAVKDSGVDRKEFFITTKVWPTDFNKKNFVPNVEQSLRDLKTEYVDLLLLHWPSDEDANKRALDLLLECSHKKYTRLTGVSNFSIVQMENARKKIPVFCNQVEYNPYKNQDAMLRYIQENNLLLTAYSPLAVGKINNDKVLISLAEKYSVTPGQLTLRWLLQQKNVSPIPKAKSEKHLKENMEVFNFTISTQDMKAISDLTQSRE